MNRHVDGNNPLASDMVRSGSTCTNSAPRVRHQLIDPTHPVRLYASAQAEPETACGLYYSEDGGRHWAHLGSGTIGTVRAHEERNWQDNPYKA